MENIHWMDRGGHFYFGSISSKAMRPMLHQNKGPGSLYIVKGGPDTIRYMDQRPLFDHIHQTNVLCKETYLAPIAAPSQTLVICALLNSIETSLQLQRFKVTKVRYMP